MRRSPASREPLAGEGVAGFQSAKQDGAQGRNRTTDTAIFNRMLYQLSYLGAEPLLLSGL
jgi:hypothetical protein